MKISIVQLLHLVLFSGLLACGQLLFKYTSGRLASDGSFVDAILELPRFPAFWLAISLYAGSTFYWIWLLTRIPLGVAYPVSALALVIVPLMSWLLFGEALAPRSWVGIALICGGVSIIAQ
jgi:undecaprenyl phosphate-alpha-L-ara4N flippase subunit ArnE